MKLLTVSVRVSGLVQGVNFRRFTALHAQRLGVRGWVLNEPDGSVSALLQHEDQAVIEAMLREIAVGPPFSRVEKVEASECIPPLPPCNDFVIQR